MNLDMVKAVVPGMLAELPAIGRSERPLPGRYFVQLLHRKDTVQLLVGHPDFYPCLEDAQQVAALFGVADDTAAKACTGRFSSQDGRSIPFRSLAFVWREQPETAAA